MRGSESHFGIEQELVFTVWLDREQRETRVHPLKQGVLTRSSQVWPSLPILHVTGRATRSVRVSPRHRTACA